MNKQTQVSVKKRKLSPFTIILAIGDMLIITFLVVAYGPNIQFRDWWVTTAIATGSHQYFANVLYSEKAINDALEANTIVESSQNTNLDDIIFHDTQTDIYESKTEEEILKRDPGNDLYKVIKIDEKGYNGYLVVIYDASRISLVTSSRISKWGQVLTDMAEENDAIIAMNASGYTFDGSRLIPTGTVIQNGKVASVGVRSNNGGLIGFTKDHKLMLTTESAQVAIKKGMWEAMTFGPFLIVNGEAAITTGNGGGGTANRTAIAQRQDGIVLFLVINGRGANGSIGISYTDMIHLFERYKAYNAANLDGGGSSELVINGKIYNNPKGFSYGEGERYIPNAWMVK